MDLLSTELLLDALQREYEKIERAKIEIIKLIKIWKISNGLGHNRKRK